LYSGHVPIHDACGGSLPADKKIKEDLSSCKLEKRQCATIEPFFAIILRKEKKTQPWQAFRMIVLRGKRICGVIFSCGDYLIRKLPCFGL